MSAEESFPSKIRLQRRLLFASILRIFLEGGIVLRGVRSLQDFWLTMPEEVRSTRKIDIVLMTTYGAGMPVLHRNNDPQSRRRQTRFTGW